MATFDEELSQLEKDIRQLKIEYDQYFGGGRKRKLDQDAVHVRIRSQLAHALHHVYGSSSVKRTFHIRSEEISVRGSSFDNGEQLAFAKFRTDIHSQLGQLARNIRVQIFRGNTIKNFQIRIASSLRISRRRYNFAKIVETDHHAIVVTDLGRGDGFIQRFAGNETM